jgi:hypothetical protein
MGYLVCDLNSHATRPASNVTRHTSHVTRRTLHDTRHTSHVTRHTSHVTRPMLSHVSCLKSQVSSLKSHVSCLMSHVSRLTSHVSGLTSHVTRHTSHVTRHTSHVTRHTSYYIFTWYVVSVMDENISSDITGLGCVKSCNERIKIMWKKEEVFLVKTLFLVRIECLVPNATGCYNTTRPLHGLCLSRLIRGIRYRGSLLKSLGSQNIIHRILSKNN